MGKYAVIAGEGIRFAGYKPLERIRLGLIRCAAFFRVGRAPEKFRAVSRLCLALFLSAHLIFTVSSQAETVKQDPTFIIKDVSYQSLGNTADIKITTNKRVEYVIYELKDPYRIVIDPLDAVWCDFDETRYFDEGMVRSVKFIKGREISGGPGEPYYPFDFISVELRYPFPHKFSNNGNEATLTIGEAAPPQMPAKKTKTTPKSTLPAKEKDIEPAKKKPAEKENALKAVKENLKKERMELDSARKELTKKKEEVDLSERKLRKEKRAVEEEKIRLSRVKKSLDKEKVKIKEKDERLKQKQEMPGQRPVKDFPEEGLEPADYLGKVLSLDDCIKAAMPRNLAVNIARERVKLAKLKVNEAFRELFPEFSLLWNKSRGKISDEIYVGRKFGFEFKQAVFHGGEQMYLWEQAKINLKVAKENLSKAKEEVIFNVTKAYYELAKSINKYNFQRKLMEDTTSDFDISKKEQKYELISQIDFMNIQSVKNTIFHTLLSYENNLSLAKLELNKAMNIEINADVKIDEKMAFKEIDADLNKCTELALKFKPEYRIAYLNTKVADLTKKIAKSKELPQVDVFGKYLKAVERLEPLNIKSLRHYLKNERVIGGTVSLPWGPHTVDYQKKRVKLAPTVTTYGSDTSSDTDNVRINLFDNMARVTNIKDASINYSQSMDELNKAEQSIYTDIRQALFSFAEARLKLKNVSNNIELFRKELEVSIVRKGQNEISFYDLIQAKIKLYAEKALYTDTLGDYYIAIAKINKAIGLGGYFK